MYARPLVWTKKIDKRLLIGFLLAGILSVALACSSADDEESTAVPAAQTQPTAVTVPTLPPAQAQPTAVTQPPPSETAELTFWNGLASQCKVRGGHLKLGNRVSEFTHLYPPQVNQVIQFSITAEVLSGLVQLNPKLNPVPDLATSWSISDDQLTYTFKLRENAKFHTGRPVTADDWIFTYDNQLDPETQSLHTKGLEGVNRPVKIDDFTLEISSSFPRASFLTKVVERASGRVMTLIDKESLAAMGPGEYNRKPVGAGPFRITDHIFGERLELEAARDTYYDPSVPCVDSVTMSNIPEDNTLIAALENGSLDMIYDFPTQFWDRLEDADGIVVDTTPDVGFQMVAFNLRGDREEKRGYATAPWDDINVIYALGNGLDREKYLARAWQGRAVAAYGAIPPGEVFFFDSTLGDRSKKAFDLELAKKRMADAGFADGFEVKVMTTSNNKVPLEVLGALLKESINVILIPDIVETSVYQPRRAAGEWDAFLGGSGGDPDPDDAIDDWFADGAKFNTYGYNDETVNRLNLKQKAAIDINDRLDFIRQISDRMDETFPGIFIHHSLQRTAYADYVKGYVWVHALRQIGAVWLDR